MTPVILYLLREKTRPSEPEAVAFFLQCIVKLKLKLKVEGMQLNFAEEDQLKWVIGNAMLPSKDLNKDFAAYIRSEGGDQYRGRTHEYAWHYFEGQTGNPPETTLLAIVCAIHGTLPKPEVQEFLARGERWEEKQRWGDALLCYRIGQNLYPEDLDLTLRIGAMYLRHDRLFGLAYRPLMAVADACPCSAEAAFLLGQCFLKSADHSDTQVEGATREDLLRWAIICLERASRLDENDATICEARDSLFNRLDLDPKTNFFR